MHRHARNASKSRCNNLPEAKYSLRPRSNASTAAAKRFPAPPTVHPNPITHAEQRQIHFLLVFGRNRGQRVEREKSTNQLAVYPSNVETGETWMGLADLLGEEELPRVEIVGDFFGGAT